MKKIFSIIICAIILLFGCSESFLDKHPEDMLSPGVYFSNPDEVKAGMIGIYAHLQTVYAVGNLPHIIEQMSGDCTRGFNHSIWHIHQKTNNDSAPIIWRSFFKIIVNANNMINTITKNYIDNEDAILTTNERNEYLALIGEAKFLRAYAYFCLARLYGDVPLFTEPWENPSNAFGIGRTSANQIYTELVIPDLEYAFTNCYKKEDLDLSQEGGRITKGAALTILGEVYLTMNDPSNAAATLKKLIVDKAAGNYELLSDFTQIWLPSNKFNVESILEINFSVAAGQPSFYFRNMDIANGQDKYKMTTCQGLNAGHKDLMDEFYANADWIRMHATFDSGPHPLSGYPIPVPLKLMPPLNDNLKSYDKIGTDYNYMITRYADALLMYAEALALTGQKKLAADYINLVRARVKMAPISENDLDIDRILHERRMELAMEGHRWYDLVRTGKAIEYISPILMSHNEYEGRSWRSTPIPEYQLLLPIPIQQIEIDQTLRQNPGY